MWQDFYSLKGESMCDRGVLCMWNKIDKHYFISVLYFSQCWKKVYEVLKPMTRRSVWKKDHLYLELCKGRHTQCSVPQTATFLEASKPVNLYRVPSACNFGFQRFLSGRSVLHLPVLGVWGQKNSSMAFSSHDRDYNKLPVLFMFLYKSPCPLEKTGQM